MVKVNLNDKRYNESSSSVNLLSNISPTSITKTGLEYYNSRIRPITDIVLREIRKRTHFIGKDVLTAILWFGNAVKDDDKNMRFVKRIMALESIANTKWRCG